MVAKVHLIDPDYRRRARISRELAARNSHAEIYEDLDEFDRCGASEGYLFVAEEATGGRGRRDIASLVNSDRAALPLVVYAHQPTAPQIVTAMLAGALDYLEWPFNPGDLDAAFRRLASEGQRKAEQQRLRAAARAKVNSLTRREREVLIQMVEGLSNKEIGVVLKISPRTVEIHRGNMMQKLGALSASDAVRIALYAGVDQSFHLA